MAIRRRFEPTCGARPNASLQPAAPARLSDTRWADGSLSTQRSGTVTAVERLVLIGATPGIADAAERRARRAADDALADHIEAVGVAAFIDEWLTNPLFAGLTHETAQRADRLRNTAAGLSSSLRLAGTGTQEPLWNRLADIACPVLLIVGAADRKFRAVADSMAELLPDATVAVIDGAGHSAHLEQPAATVQALLDWVAERP